MFQRLLFQQFRMITYTYTIFAHIFTFYLFENFKLCKSGSDFKFVLSVMVMMSFAHFYTWQKVLVEEKKDTLKLYSQKLMAFFVRPNSPNLCSVPKQLLYSFINCIAFERIFFSCTLYMLIILMLIFKPLQWSQSEFRSNGLNNLKSKLFPISNSESLLWAQ